MTEAELRHEITETGRELLRDGLVARTWGNVSGRLDAENFLITPSGLSYTQTQDSDLAVYHPADKTWHGPHKPSSEKGIHAAAYELFPEVNFVIHTHQTYASAIGVWGFEQLPITEEERKTLGGIALATYGLPGTKKLKKAVTKAFFSGAHTVLMEHHGAVIAGASKAEAYERALLLEEICQRGCQGVAGPAWSLDVAQQEAQKQLLVTVQREFPHALWVETDAVVRWSCGEGTLRAQLDDMAQMIGREIPRVDQDATEIMAKLQGGSNALFVRNLGAIVCGRDAEDTEALQILVDKAAVSALHTKDVTVGTALSSFDCALMHFVYQKKYSKQKNG